MNELLTALDIDLSFDGRLYAATGEIEDFFFVFLNSHTFDACGNESSGNEFLHTGSIAVEDHRLEGANTVSKGDKDEFIIRNDVSVG